MGDRLKVIKEEKPWYSKGLNFGCTECGQCCTGAPGYIWVTQEEMEAVAKHLDITFEQFTRRYVRKVFAKYSLVEKKQSYDCIFLKGKKCTIYSVRPKQCRTFPWWPENLSSPEAWKEAARYCEGIDPNAPLVPYEEIEKQLNLKKE